MQKNLLYVFMMVMGTLSLISCGGSNAPTSSNGNSNTTPLEISNISVSNISSNSVTINWTTTLATSARVHFGPTNSYGSAADGTPNVMNHSVNLNNLAPSTLYHYQVLSTDGSNNSLSSTDATFTTSASGMQQVFCESQSVIYCNGLENANPPNQDSSIFLRDPYSGLQTTTYLEQGYSNSQFLGTGALRFTLRDGTEDDTGVDFPNGGQLNLPTQLNIGFTFRLGPNYLAPHLEGAKFIMAYGTTRAQGWRPTVFIQFVTDTEGRVGPPGTRYAVLTAADDGAGLASDEFGQGHPQDAYASGMTHTFRLNNYVDQWVYVEWEVHLGVVAGVSLGNTHRLYVATRDGAFDGTSPIAEITSTAADTSLPWDFGRANAYTEALVGTTADSYVDVDLLRLSNSYMGPPPGFFE